MFETLNSKTLIFHKTFGHSLVIIKHRTFRLEGAFIYKKNFIVLYLELRCNHVTLLRYNWYDWFPSIHYHFLFHLVIVLNQKSTSTVHDFLPLNLQLSALGTWPITKIISLQSFLSDYNCNYYLQWSPDSIVFIFISINNRKVMKPLISIINIRNLRSLAK